MIWLEGGGRRVADVAGLATCSPFVFCVVYLSPPCKHWRALVACSAGLLD